MRAGSGAFLAAGLAACLIACERSAPTGPGARTGASRLALRLVRPDSPVGRSLDSLEFSVYDDIRRLAGPVFQSYDGSFEAALQVPAGPGRIAVVSAFGEESGLGTGALYLGVSDPFAVGSGDTSTVTVTLEPFMTNFNQTQTVWIGDAELTWDAVPSAARYTVREERESGGPVDRVATGTAITIPAGDEPELRTFRVRAENAWATGAFSSALTIEIRPEPAGRTWTIVHDGSGDAPGPRIEQASAWDPVTRSLYVFGGVASTLEKSGAPGDTTLWCFSASEGRWIPLSRDSGGGPGPREYAALATSPDGAFIYVFGGVDQYGGGMSYFEIWRFDRSARRWTLLESTDEAVRAGMPFEAAADAHLWQSSSDLLRLYVPATSQVWSYRIGQRTWVTPDASGGIPERGFPSTAWEAGSRRLFVYGGLPEELSERKLWSWSESGGWVTVPADTTGAPIARTFGSGAVRTGGFYLLGGFGETSGDYFDLWEYRAGTGTVGQGRWRSHATGQPLYLFRPGVGYDAATNRLLTFGGINQDGAVRALDLSPVNQTDF